MNERRGFTPFEVKISNRGSKRYLTGFTLIELLVVIAVIVLLMAILMPVLARVRKQAKATVCQSNLRQWSFIWFMYTDDNNSYFVENVAWVNPLRPYYRDGKLHCCPAAGKDYQYGYGINGYVTNPQTPPGFEWSDVYPDNWRTPNVRGAANVPMFLDCQYLVGWPRQNDMPPQWEDEPWVNNLSNNMLRFCRNRHNRTINGVFLNFSVRKIGLKELWTLKWHRSFDTNGRWTKAGGITPDEWPDWMRNFKDY